MAGPVGRFCKLADLQTYVVGGVSHEENRVGGERFPRVGCRWTFIFEPWRAMSFFCSFGWSRMLCKSDSGRLLAMHVCAAEGVTVVAYICFAFVWANRPSVLLANLGSA